jgi:A/G-specific adenine glycosylase
MIFVDTLYEWHSSVERNLPWKTNQDPYKIWLSEIILQQTRVEQGTPYYLRFVSKWPTIFDLAKASEDEVLSMWQGLGYYSRGRNLLKTARQVVQDYNGVFPKEISEIKKLKGIGDYTSAAILSFAYDLPHPVVDGNVKRFIARYFGIAEAIDTSLGKDIIVDLTNKVFDQNDPARFNQAIIDFGALQCKPKPLCDICPFSLTCKAYLEDLVSIIPTKSKVIKKKTRFLHFLFISDGMKTIIHRRGESDIWAGLYQFPLIETSNPQIPNVELNDFYNLFDIDFIDISSVIIKTQLLTHQKLEAKIYQIEANFKSVEEPFILVNVIDLTKYAMPQLLVESIKQLLESQD